MLSKIYLKNINKKMLMTKYNNYNKNKKDINKNNLIFRCKINNSNNKTNFNQLMNRQILIVINNKCSCNNNIKCNFKTSK